MTASQQLPPEVLDELDSKGPWQHSYAVRLPARMSLIEHFVARQTGNDQISIMIASSGLLPTPVEVPFMLTNLLANLSENWRLWGMIIDGGREVYIGIDVHVSDEYSAGIMFFPGGQQ